MIYPVEWCQAFVMIRWTQFLQRRFMKSMRRTVYSHGVHLRFIKAYPRYRKWANAIWVVEHPKDRPLVIEQDEDKISWREKRSAMKKLKEMAK